MDHGEKAIKSAIEHWNEIDMMYTGAYKNKEDSETLRIIETDEGISVAFLAYTYGTNGIPVPAKKEYLVNMIDRDKISSDSKEANEQADVTILSFHFGDEYERVPNKEQKELAQFAADEGVHIVLGHHPHVLQPAEWVTGKDGNETFVIYSLGNFFSGQDGLYHQIGGILKLNIRKIIDDKKEMIEVRSPQFLITFMKSKDDKNYKNVPMYQLNNKDLKDANEHYEEIKDHMTQWMPELQFIEE